MVIVEDGSNNFDAITLGTVQHGLFNHIVIAIYDPILIGIFQNMEVS
jgi:hypothetical protein